MEYEKGKQIEDVIRQLQYIVGYYDEKETDLEKIYDKVNSAISDLKRVLGQEY